MANNIVLAKNYTDLLDESYKKASVTADLISDALKLFFKLCVKSQMV